MLPLAWSHSSLIDERHHSRCALPGAVRPHRRLGQSADNVLVVVNDSSADSQRVGDYYARKRTIPADHTIRITTTTDESISRADYTRQIEQPIAKFLTAGGLQDRVLYIVLTKGVPLRVAGSSGRSGTVASVDSELTLLYRKMTGELVAPVGAVSNPYFLGNRSLSEAQSFTHADHDIFLVTEARRIHGSRRDGAGGPGRSSLA